MHALHSVTFDDGSVQVTLEPPRWRGMSYAWTPVRVSSIFETEDGGALKQFNIGATQRVWLTITITGCQEPPILGLDQTKSWLITLIARDKLDETEQIDAWPVDVPSQTADAKTARRAWSMEFREV